MGNNNFKNGCTVDGGNFYQKTYYLFNKSEITDESKNEICDVISGVSEINKYEIMRDIVHDKKGARSLLNNDTRQELRQKYPYDY